MTDFAEFYMEALHKISELLNERDDARRWARKLYRDNQALLAQVQQLQRALFEMHKREQQHNQRPTVD